MSSLWEIAGYIAASGGIGGVVAALLSEDKGFVLPTRMTNAADGTKSNVIRPGFIGLILIGAIAATVSWALYGPAADLVLLSTSANGQAAGSANLTLAAIGGAVLVGSGGSKWISGQVDKTLLRQTASVAAGRQPADAQVAHLIATAAPSQALQAAQTMKV
ncbi:MAG TPA: hypothetical protein VG247_33465 [Pseudonocardiaceae bacterium]|nr:hypothetical protein [Pseudonocardiaceae bacterium]